MFKIFCFLSLISSFAAATVTDPIGFSWEWSCGLTLVISGLGSFFDYHTDRQKVESGDPVIMRLSIVGLSAIAGLMFFAFFRSVWDDSLQIAVISGVCGIYGRRALQPLADKIIEKLK